MPAVLVLQALHLADHGRIHAAILRAPLIEGRRAHAMLAAQLSHRHTSLGLAQDRKDLGFVESRHLHQIILSHLAEKILHPHPLSFGEDYHTFFVPKFPLDFVKCVFVHAIPFNAPEIHHSNVANNCKQLEYLWLFELKNSISDFVFRVKRPAVLQHISISSFSTSANHEHICSQGQTPAIYQARMDFATSSKSTHPTAPL
jgi:hypothetical protein